MVVSKEYLEGRAAWEAHKTMSVDIPYQAWSQGWKDFVYGLNDAADKIEPRQKADGKLHIPEGWEIR